MSVDKINWDDLIHQYEVQNVEAFIHYLKQVWKDLNRRTDLTKEGIDKITFGKYYELPGLISERLFSVFDSTKTGYLSLNDFVSNMVSLFSSNFNRLLEFVLKFYDFDNDGKITKEDVRVVLSYVPVYKKSKNSNELKFEKDNFEDRLASQQELHKKLDTIFGEKKSLNLKEFTSIIQNVNSDIFLFILIFLYEHRPFSAETIKNLENIKKSPRLSPRKQDNLIASPNLDSKLVVSQTLRKSPVMKSCTIREKNPQAYKNMKYLSLVSGRKDDTSSQLKESIPLTYSLKIPDKIDEEGNKQKDQNEEIERKKPKRKHLKNIAEMDKITTKDPLKMKSSSELENLSLAFAKPFEGTQVSSSKEFSEFGSKLDDDEFSFNSEDNNEVEEEHINKSNDIVEGYLYKIQDNKVKKIYFKLICKDLYFYKSKEDKRHKGMHNLTGVYIKDEGPITINIIAQMKMIIRDGLKQ